MDLNLEHKGLVLPWKVLRWEKIGDAVPENDYFNAPVPDGISHAINDYLGKLECANADSYELLEMTFGEGVCGELVKAAGEAEYQKFAESIKEWFELSYLPTKEDAKNIIDQALLDQWGG